MKNQYPIKLYKTDIQDRLSLEDIFKNENNPKGILHLAAQVAVTTSVSNPRNDFNVNALGTLNILEAVRNYCPEVPFIFSSTNKVYGLLNSEKISEGAKRYKIDKKKEGISETEPLDFHSPMVVQRVASTNTFFMHAFLILKLYPSANPVYTGTSIWCRRSRVVSMVYHRNYPWKRNINFWDGKQVIYYVRIL